MPTYLRRYDRVRPCWKISKTNKAIQYSYGDDVLRKENQWMPQARNLGPITNLSMMIVGHFMIMMIKIDYYHKWTRAAVGRRCARHQDS